MTESRERYIPHEVSDNGNSQLECIEFSAAIRCPNPEPETACCSGDRADEHPPVEPECGAEKEQNLRRNGNRSFRLIEHGRELRKYNSGQQDDQTCDRSQDHHGIDHCLNDLAAQIGLPFQEDGEIAEDAIQTSRGFTCSYNADVQRVEYVGMAFEGRRQTGTSVDTRKNVLNDVFQFGMFRSLGKIAESAGDWNA